MILKGTKPVLYSALELWDFSLSCLALQYQFCLKAVCFLHSFYNLQLYMQINVYKVEKSNAAQPNKVLPHSSENKLNPNK